MHYITVLLLCFLIALPGCMTHPTIQVVPQLPIPGIEKIAQDVQTRPIILDRVIIDVPKETILGESRRGLFCVGPSPLIWNAGTVILRDGGYHKKFFEVARAYGFNMYETKNEAFKAFDSSLLIAATITRVNHNSCFMIHLLRLFNKYYMGSVKFAVKWEVYSLSSKQVIMSFESEGSAVVDEFRPLNEVDYYYAAFGNALRILFNNADFRKATEI